MIRKGRLGIRGALFRPREGGFAPGNHVVGGASAASPGVVGFAPHELEVELVANAGSRRHTRPAAFRLLQVHVGHEGAEHSKFWLQNLNGRENCSQRQPRHGSTRCAPSAKEYGRVVKYNYSRLFEVRPSLSGAPKEANEHVGLVVARRDHFVPGRVAKRLGD